MHMKLPGLIIAAFALSVYAAPAKPLTVQRVAGDKRPSGYIVRLKNGADKNTLLREPRLRAAVTHHDWTAINGFAGNFDAGLLDELRASDIVESISEDGVGRSTAVQTNAPWGLSRISSKAQLSSSNDLALNYTYTYSDSFQGQGVDVYVVDTGVNINHVEFGGRASYGYNAPGLAQLDDNGHGSNVASIVGGATYGVAKQARIISVKVLDQNSRGFTSDFISGFNYALAAAQASGRPSVITASLETDAPSDAFDQATAAVIAAGVPVIVAAGNRNSDELHSPARVATAITVAAIGITDTKADFSNYGSGIDFWAPGLNIYGAWYTGTTSQSLYYGTSQATPHVTGLVALYLSQFGKTSPAAIVANINHQDGVLKGIPSGTVNRLAVGPITV